jgi:ribosomal protein L7/L12
MRLTIVSVADGMGISAANIVREMFPGLSLAMARYAVQNTPIEVATFITRKSAEEFKAKFEDAQVVVAVAKDGSEPAEDGSEPAEG